MSRALTVSVALLLCLSPLVGAVAAGSANHQVTLTVSVRTPSDQPVGDAQLSVTWDGGSRNETTAGNGKAFVDVPAGANATVTVSHPRFVRNDPVEVTNATDREVGVTVFPRASLTVAVADSNGAPVSNARVRLFKRDYVAVNATSVADGTVATGAIESGEYRVVVTKPGFLTREFTRQTGDAPWNLTVERGFVTLTLSVRDDHFATPRPIENATIEGPTIGSIRATSDGQRSVSVPVNTAFRVTVRKPGYRSISRRIAIGEESVRIGFLTRRIPRINLTTIGDRVVVGERLLVEATNEYGEPVVNASVLLNNERTARTDADGEARIRIESVGEQTIRIRKGNVRSDQVSVVGIEARTPTPSPTATPSPTVTPTPAATPTGTPTADRTTPSPTSGSGIVPDIPGFGILVSALALLVAVELLRRRSRA